MRINSLTSLRFIFALWVVLLHTTADPVYGAVADHWPSLKPYILHGYLGVTFFFVLSGFVLVLAYRDKFQTDFAKAFYQARFARIYPTYAVAMLLELYFVWQYLIHKSYAIAGHVLPGSFVLLIAIILAALLLQAWFALTAQMWNPPSWTLSAEMFFYAIFPRIARKWDGWRVKQLLQTLILIWLGLMLLGALLSLPVAAKLGERVNSILLVNPLLRSMEFLSGMVLGFLYLKHFSIVSLDRKTSGTIIISVCLIAICSVMTIFSAEKQWMNIAFTTPFLGIIILNLALFNSWWGLENKYMVLLGDSSYCMYIIHGPINMWFHQAIRFDLFTLPGSAILMIYLFTVIAISVLIHQYFERPVNQYIRRRLLAGRN